MSLSLEITMKSHDRDSSRKVPCAEICLEVILPAAVCIMECRGGKVVAGRPIRRFLQLPRPEVIGPGLG